MVLEENELAQATLFLSDKDFPREYVDMAHPDDYKAVQEFTPQLFMHTYYGFHERLIARVAWKASDGTVVPMSFICDTGAPGFVYLSPKASRALASKGLLMADEATGRPYVRMHKDENSEFDAPTQETPRPHTDANVLGVRALMKLHFKTTDDGFSFDRDFVYL